MNSKASVGKMAQSLMRQSTLHGCPRLLNDDGIFYRIFWSILVFLGVSAAIYFIVADIVSFFEFATLQTTSTVVDPIVQFPAVTFCNLMPFDFQEPGNFEVLHELVSDEIPTINKEVASEMLDLLQAKIMYNQIHNFTFGNSSRSLETLGFDFSFMVLSCSFNGIDCQRSDFFWTWSYQYGNCYTFNKKINDSSVVRRINSQGPKHGLTMELFAGVPGFNDQFLSTSGFYVGVNNNSESIMTDYVGNIIPVGSSTWIAIRKEVYSKLEYPYSNCTRDIDDQTGTNDQEVLDKALNGDSVYLEIRCVEICLQKYFIHSYCQCQDPSLSLFDHALPICQNLSQISCVEDYKETLSPRATVAVCNGICPAKCDTHSFYATLSSGSYPTKYYANTTLKRMNQIYSRFERNNITDITREDLALSTAKFTVYYDSLSYKLIEDVAKKNGSSLLGTLGGLLGLFVGLSLLSLFEFVELFIKLGFYVCCQRSRHKRIEVKPRK